MDAVAVVNGELLNTQRFTLQGINVYPTLVSQNKPIHIDAPVLSKISVLDIQGREINFSRNQDAVSISSIGTYFLHITHQGKSYTQKICVR